MKRALIIIASMFIVVSIAGIASAETVNIGTAALDRSDDNDIRDLVAGVKAAVPAAPVTPRPTLVNIGPAEIDAAELAALQDYVSGRKTVVFRSAKTPREDQVNLGLVEMSRADVQDLKRLTSWMQKKRPGGLPVVMPVALLK